MKFIGLVYTVLLAVAFVEDATVANPTPEAETWYGYCYRSGGPCSKLKRAAEAAAEAIADAGSCHGFCYGNGEPCSKAKRDALALAEATAEAFAAADPGIRPCHAPGAPCSKAKREALSCGHTSHSTTCKLTKNARALLYVFTC